MTWYEIPWGPDVALSVLYILDDGCTDVSRDPSALPVSRWAEVRAKFRIGVDDWLVRTMCETRQLKAILRSAIERGARMESET